MLTECSNCLGEAAEVCALAYRISAQRVTGPTEDLIMAGVSPDHALRVIAKTRDRELNALTYISRAVLPTCNLSPEELKVRLDEAIVEAGDTLSSS